MVIHRIVYIEASAVDLKRREKRKEQGFIFSTVKVFTGTKLQKKREMWSQAEKERRGTKEKGKQNATVKSRKKQRQGRELNQHSTFSSSSPSSSPQRASAEGKKRNRDHQPAWPTFSLSPEAVTTGYAQKLQYHCLYPSQLPERERKKIQKTRQKKREKAQEKRKKEEKP